LTLGLDVGTGVFPLIEIVCEDLNSEKLFVDTAATGGQAEALVIAEARNNIDFSILDVMDHVVVDELQEPTI
jgi:hypothetical protein